MLCVIHVLWEMNAFLIPKQSLHGFAISQLLLLFLQLTKRQYCHQIEPSQLICTANQLTGFYMIASLVFNELN